MENANIFAGERSRNSKRIALTGGAVRRQMGQPPRDTWRVPLQRRGPPEPLHRCVPL
jgi:hypothetical protein